MRHLMLFICLLCLFLLEMFPLVGGWVERKAEGWAWYEDPEQIKKTPEEEFAVEVDPLAFPTPLSAAKEIANVRKNLEEKLARAVLEPTDKNVSDYMLEQQKWVNQSGDFSKTWAKVLLQQPNLDATLNQYPVSQYGIQVQKQIQQEERAKLMQRLIQSCGLFYFYEGQNKISQAFGLVIQEFSKKYGWQVVAVSKDGFLLDGFHDNFPDNGIVQNLGIQQFPSLFLINPKTSEITPIAFGLASLDQIENNIMLQFSEWVEEDQ